MVAEVPDECLFQLGTLGAHPGSGHLGQDLGVAFTTDQGGHHVPPGDIRAVDGGIHRVCTAGRAGLDTNHRLCLRCEHRTRVIVVLSALWSGSWLMTGLSGLLPGSPAAAVLLIGGSAVFGLGETLRQPTIPAITNDLTPDHLCGRYNAVMAGAFQLAAVTGPVVAGVMLGAHFKVEFIGMLILGCAAMAVIALAVERRIPAQANGIKTPAAELRQA